MKEHLAKAEHELSHAKEKVHRAKQKEDLEPEEAHELYSELDGHLERAAESSQATGHEEHNRISQEIHKVRRDLREWYDRHRDPHTDAETHHTFDRFHSIIDDWMEGIRESGREW